MLERDRRYVLGRTILTRRRFVLHLVLLDESMIFYAWMATNKGAEGNMTGTSVREALERGQHGTPLAARSSSVPGVTNAGDGRSPSLVVVKLPHRS